MQEIKRCLALDIGEKTIGVAVSDLLGFTAQGVTTIQRKSKQDDLKMLGELIVKYEVDTVVVGLPKHMNGTEGESCKMVRKFTNKIMGAYPKLKIKYWDERLSTAAAEKSLIAADVSRKKRKTVIDKMAAVHILQGYLDSIN